MSYFYYKIDSYKAIAKFLWRFVQVNSLKRINYLTLYTKHQQPPKFCLTVYGIQIITGISGSTEHFMNCDYVQILTTISNIVQLSVVQSWTNYSLN